MVHKIVAEWTPVGCELRALSQLRPAGIHSKGKIGVRFVSDSSCRECGLFVGMAGKRIVAGAYFQTLRARGRCHLGKRLRPPACLI